MMQGTRDRRRIIPGERPRFLALLVSLLALFALSPLILALEYGIILMNIVGVIVLLLGVNALSERKGAFAAAAILAACTLISNSLMILHPGKGITTISYGLVLLLLGLFSISILGYVLRAGQISADRIFAAVCVYLMVGYAWAFGYAMVELLVPGSFSGLVANGELGHAERVMQMRYFSFATLTTVGYGDIVPRSPTARTLATLEAITGQIYLTVLVARLVGLHIVHASAPRPDNDK